MKKLTFFLIGSLVSIVAFSSIAFANGNVSITRAEPDPNSKNNTWFVLESQAGESIENCVLIKNMSSEKIKVRILAIDSKSNKAGRFILKRSEEQQSSIGKWTKLETNEAELAPFQALPVKFKITIPKKTKAGEYAGGIIAEEITGLSKTSTVSTRIGNRIYLKVPGYVNHNLRWLAFNSNTSDFNIKNLFHKTHYFKFTLENKGNTVVRPSVSINILNIFGNKVETINKKLGELQPNTLAEPLIKWDNAPLFGRFKVKATINLSNTANKQQTITREITITIISWKTLAFSILIIIALIIATISYRKKNIPKSKS